MWKEGDLRVRRRKERDRRDVEEEDVVVDVEEVDEVVDVEEVVVHAVGEVVVPLSM